MEDEKLEIFGSYTIYDDGADYELSANIDFNNGNKFYMPIFEFRNITDDSSKTKLMWDNGNYLLKLYYALEKYDRFEKTTKEELEILKDLSATLNNNREDFQIIYQMLKKGISIGMFNDELHNANS